MKNIIVDPKINTHTHTLSFFLVGGGFPGGNFGGIGGGGSNTCAGDYEAHSH